MRRVYFIKPVGLCGPIKIGCSYSPDSRRRTLATWSPFALEIVAEIEGDYTLERRFHAMFADQYERREWFAWSRRLQSVINQIASGEFDVANLPPPINIVRAGEETKAKHRASWTPERRKLHSLMGRVRHARKRSGLLCQDDEHTALARGDEAALARIEAYIADPFTHGETFEQRRARKAARKAAA